MKLYYDGPIGADLLFIDLDHAPYVLYGVKNIDLVSLAPFLGPIGTDLLGGSAPYAVCAPIVRSLKPHFL